MKRALCALVLLLAPVGAAQAVANCSVSATVLAFGGYNPFSATPLDSAGDITVSCSLGGLLSLLVSYEVKLATGGSGGFSPRRMSNGANTLNYNLYTNSGRSTVWGNGSGSTATISDGYLLGLGTTVRHYAVYGRVPALQNTRSGGYLDSITVTVEY
jgi:spore coat protein U-like protein